MRHFRFLLGSMPSNVSATFKVSAPTYSIAERVFREYFPQHFAERWFSAEEWYTVPKHSGAPWGPVTPD